MHDESAGTGFESGEAEATGPEIGEGADVEPRAEEDEPDRDRPAWLRYVALGGLIVAALALGWLAWLWITWPDVGALRTGNPETTAFIELDRASRRDRGLDTTIAWIWVSYARISPNLKRVVVASEDTEFFFHEGFSAHEMREALRQAVRDRTAPRGASTITQQLAKNLWLSPRRTIFRKVREGILTRQLEAELSKERILELYLNVVEFGPGLYGAEAAARRYFGIGAADLSLRQAAMLAAVLPRPKGWNPESDAEAYRRRVDRILEVERQLGYLDRYVGRPEPAPVRVTPPDAAGLLEPDLP